MSNGEVERPRLEVVNGHLERDTRFLGNEYPQLMTRHITDACVRQGLNIDFVPAFREHMQDLNVVVREDLKFPDAPPSSLGVYRVRLPGDDLKKDPQWHRLLIISQREVNQRKTELQEVIEQRGITGLDVRKLAVAATDWIFYEHTLAIIGNVCYMQRAFPNGYRQDFNGQSPYYKTELQMSADYLMVHGDKDLSIQDDFDAMKKGFGLMMLHEDLLMKGIVGKAKLADWIIEELRTKYPHAYRRDEIAAHFEAVQPDRDVMKKMAEYVLAVFDPEEDADE